jgi:hypothetical protein
MSFSSLVRVGTAAAAIAMLVAQTGCARQQASTSDSTPASYASLVFANESPEQVEVWAVTPDISTRRIGTAMAGETSTIRVPNDFQGRVSFYAKVRGSSAIPHFESYDLQPGAELRVRLDRNAKKISKVQ